MNKFILLLVLITAASCQKEDTIKGCIRCEQQKYLLLNGHTNNIYDGEYPKISEGCDKTAQELVDTIAHIPTVVLGRLYERYELDSTTLKMYMITTKCEQR